MVSMDVGFPSLAILNRRLEAANIFIWTLHLNPAMLRFDVTRQTFRGSATFSAWIAFVVLRYG